MKLSRIVFFFTALFVAQTVLGILMVVFLDKDNTSLYVPLSHLFNGILMTLVFTLMSRESAAPPYLLAFALGVGLLILDIVIVNFFIGTVARSPTELLVNVFLLGVAVVIGVNIGCYFRKTVD